MVLVEERSISILVADGRHWLNPDSILTQIVQNVGNQFADGRSTAYGCEVRLILMNIKHAIAHNGTV